MFISKNKQVINGRNCFKTEVNNKGAEYVSNIKMY